MPLAKFTFRQLRIILFFVVIVLAGCAAPTRDEADHTSKAEEEQALAYLDAGDFNAAAEEYRRLSESNKSRSDYFLLKSANAYVRGGQHSFAEPVLNELHVEKLDTLQRAELGTLHAHIAVSKNDATGALSKLDFDLPADASLELFALYYSARASAYQLSGQNMAAVHSLVKMGQFSEDPVSLQENNNKIWELLSSVSITELEQERSAATTASNAILAGWLDLSVIAKSAIYNQQDLENSITAWSQQYPGHPAQPVIIEKIIALARQANTRPEQIALLLPFDSQYSDISNAIREGFLSAWFETPGEKPVIRIYNSNTRNIVDIYNTAVNEGADFVVGPLEKEAVTTLLETGAITVNTLALNQISNDSGQDQQNPQTGIPANFFQFGLIPEDEARQAAERAWFDGHANALIITPDTTWGERIYNAFSTRWTELGGIIVERVRIPAGIQDFSTPVKQLLNIDNSEQRTKQLVATLHRKIESEPRYRRDADILFLASTPLIARQIVPQLRYYQANDIITYSISSIYSGNFDPQANSDINDVVFSDMPWMLDSEQEYSAIQQSLNKHWNQFQSPYRRFYAFGVDAYRIIPELGRLYVQNDWFNGVTGKLTVTSLRQIQRKSAWAKFIDGSPQLLGTE